MTDAKDPESGATEDAPPDLNDLAKRYLDLWQAQVNAMAGDAEAAKTMAGTMAMMSAGAQAFADAAQSQAGAQADAATGAQQNDHGPAAPAAPAGAAHGDAGARLDQFDERLAALEGRIARLESELSRVGGKVDGRDRRDDP